MKKLIKFVGKILALPFSITGTVLKVILLPITLITQFLNGNAEDIKTTYKFSKDLWKFCMSRLKEDKPFYFSITTGYGDSEVNEHHSLIKGNYYFNNRIKKITNVIHQNANTSEQKGKKCN